MENFDFDLEFKIIEFNKEFNIYIEGELCPNCSFNLEHKWKDITRL